jgi:hypothetical protein
LHINDSEFWVLSHIYENTHKKPTMTEYRRDVRGTKMPKAHALLEQYGSTQAVVDQFVELYHSVHGYISVPEYLLGCLAGRTSLVQRTSGWKHLRFITSDEDQLDAMMIYMHNVAVHPLRKQPLTLELRCSDHHLTSSLEHMGFFDETPFIASPDFVRGYCDTHSSFRTYPTSHQREMVRMTISGPLVPQVHDYLVELGANNTQVLKEETRMRMHVQATSLRRIRETLYPLGCVCNVRKRMMIYRA